MFYLSWLFPPLLVLALDYTLGVHIGCPKQANVFGYFIFLSSWQVDFAYGYGAARGVTNVFL